VTGVSNANLAAVNSSLATMGYAATDSTAKLQAVVDGYAAVLAAADSTPANTQTLRTRGTKNTPRGNSSSTKMG
jgi:hypothetical protein